MAITTLMHSICKRRIHFLWNFFFLFQTRLFFSPPQVQEKFQNFNSWNFQNIFIIQGIRSQSSKNQKFQHRFTKVSRTPKTQTVLPSKKILLGFRDNWTAHKIFNEFFESLQLINKVETIPIMSLEEKAGLWKLSKVKNVTNRYSNKDSRSHYMVH